MRNTIVFVGVLTAGVLTWFGYAFIAALATDSFVNDCLWSNTVLALFFTTGWILPLLVGYDFYKFLHRNEMRRERMIIREMGEIKRNTFEVRKSRNSSSFRNLHEQVNLN